MACSSRVRPRQRPASFGQQRAQSLYRTRGLVNHHEYRYWTASYLSELPASLTPQPTGACDGWLEARGPATGRGSGGSELVAQPCTQEPTMPEPGDTPVPGPRTSEGTVTLLTPTKDKPANLGAGGSPHRRVPPGLAALAAQFPGLHVEEMLCHDGKSLVAAGRAGDQSVVIKVLADGDPGWRHRQRHEIGVYQIFAEHPPPVRVPRLVHTDGQRIVVMERLQGATLGSGRYPRVLTGAEVLAAVTLVGRLHGWQPLPDGFRQVFVYHQR